MLTIQILIRQHRIRSSFLPFHICKFLFKKYFIYLFMIDTEREAETEGEGEAGSLQGARCGTQSLDPEITIWAKGTEPPRRPSIFVSFLSINQKQSSRHIISSFDQFSCVKPVSHCCHHTFLCIDAFLMPLGPRECSLDPPPFMNTLLIQCGL